MPSHPAHAMRFLRLSALMLLVLGLLARPMVEQMGDVHAVEHAVLAAADADHDQGHADHDHADHDTGKDPDHAKGSHGLMHQAECGAADAQWAVWDLPLAVPSSTSPPMPDAIAPRLGIPATPFRPPIA